MAEKMTESKSSIPVYIFAILGLIGIVFLAIFLPTPPVPRESTSTNPNQEIRGFSSEVTAFTSDKIKVVLHYDLIHQIVTENTSIGLMEDFMRGKLSEHFQEIIPKYSAEELIQYRQNIANNHNIKNMVMELGHQKVIILETVITNIDLGIYEELLKNRIADMVRLERAQVDNTIRLMTIKTEGQDILRNKVIDKWDGSNSIGTGLDVNLINGGNLVGFEAAMSTIQRCSYERKENCAGVDMDIIKSNIRYTHDCLQGGRC